jgi:protein TonB
MKKILVLTVAILSTLFANTTMLAENPVTPKDTTVYNSGAVDVQPKLNGGVMHFIAEHMDYPDDAYDNNIHGKVVVSFVVEPDGTRTDYKVVKGVFPSLDKEALRILKIMPNWIPGKIDGTPVRVLYYVPVTFAQN